jgi:hypothetical protein
MLVSSTDTTASTARRSVGVKSGGCAERHREDERGDCQPLENSCLSEEIGSRKQDGREVAKKGFDSPDSGHNKTEACSISVLWAVYLSSSSRGRSGCQDILFWRQAKRVDRSDRFTAFLQLEIALPRLYRYPPLQSGPDKRPS